MLKRELDVERFYEVIDWLPWHLGMGFELQRDEVPVACWWCSYNRLYQSVWFDAFIVAEDERQGGDGTRAICRIAVDVAKAIAEVAGATHLCFSTPIPEIFLKHLPDWKRGEQVLELELEREVSDADE